MGHTLQRDPQDTRGVSQYLKKIGSSVTYDPIDRFRTNSG